MAALGVLVSLAAFWIGLTLPDMDLHLWLGHRNALTHSVLLPTALAAKRAWRAAAGGLAGGMGLHLAADTFPNRMIGFARVKLPFAGALTALESYLWLGLNAIAALALATALAVRLHPPRSVVLLAIGTVAGGASYLWRTDGGWPVLAIFAVLAWIAWRRVDARAHLR
jgi:hypothetical protein